MGAGGRGVVAVKGCSSCITPPPGSISQLQNCRITVHILKIMANIMPIILPAWALEHTLSILYIMGIYTSYQACREQNSHSCTVHETICQMSAPLEWEITHIMWLQALVLLWGVKCCNPDQAHQCWCLNDFRWGWNTLVGVFFVFLIHIQWKRTQDKQRKIISNMDVMHDCQGQAILKCVWQFLKHVLHKI